MTTTPKKTDEAFLDEVNRQRGQRGQWPAQSVLDVEAPKKTLPATGIAALRLTRPHRGARRGEVLEFRMSDQAQRLEAGELLDRDAAEIVA